jgi:uncharacterized protein (UPF0276 family)
MKRAPTAGLSFKPQHFDAALADPAAGLWFEVHAENYMVAGGPRLAMLEALRHERPLSLHGVGLSLAADADPDPAHLARLKVLADRFAPFAVSEHLAWSAWGGVYHGDLLPFPRTAAALERIVRNVDIAQTTLGRRLLIENPSLYADLDGQDMDEAAFLGALVRRTGCGLLVDVNNAFISAHNLGRDAGAYLDALPADAIGEVHLAGHAPDPELGEALLIDTHGAPVAEPVWSLYRRLIARIGPRPPLIERDQEVPPFATLMAERQRAADMLARLPDAPATRSAPEPPPEPAHV